MSRYKKVLFATDLSASSKQIYDTAASIVDEQAGSLSILHVVEAVHVVEEAVAFDASGSIVPISGAVPVHHQALIEHLREEYPQKGSTKTTYLVRDGSVTEEILAAAQEMGCDLIIVGTHGRKGLSHLLVGSVAERVLKQAQCAVLAFGQAGASKAPEKINLILHPTDFSSEAEAALEVAKSLADLHNARLVLMNVATLEVFAVGGIPLVVDSSPEQEALENLRKKIESPKPRFRLGTLLKKGDPAEEILAAANELGCSMILMGTHGCSGLSRLLMGSVAEAVLKKAICPVLIVKGERAKAAVEEILIGKVSVTLM